MCKKKEVYIPIEIKPRELISQIFLAGELCKKGVRVFIGSKITIDRYVKQKNNDQGVYLYKGGGSKVSKFKNISKRVKSIIVLDQEISPGVKKYDAIKKRFIKGTLKYVKRLYYIGKNAKKAAIKQLKEIDPNQIKDFGWPRVDLWMPSKHYIWSQEINKIQSKFGNDFYLFSSDFGINSKKLCEERSIRYGLVGAKKTDYEIKIYRKSLENVFQNFEQFVDFLNDLDNDPKIPLIIVRPHPAEDHDVWIQKTLKLKKIKVIYEGEITPWLLASKGLLHRGCTTAIQAFLSKKKIGFLKNFSSEDNNSIVSELSSNLTSLNTIVKWICSSEDESTIRNKNNILNDHITFDKKSATEKISEDILKFTGYEVKLNIFSKESILKKILKEIYLYLLKIKGSIKKNPHELGILPKKNKMQDGIIPSEISKYLYLMYPNKKFNVTELISDLCYIEEN
jgi:surface carbohydrate biosynthesis protein